MNWLDASHLCFDLFALGRVFFLTPTLPAYMPGEPFPPALGKSVSTMLDRAIACGVAANWHEAEKWCLAAESSQQLDALYHGKMDVTYASAVAQFFHAAVWVGMMHWLQAIEGLEKCAATLAFQMPDAGAVVWLALAQLYCFHCDAARALWAWQKSDSLIYARTTPTANRLRELLDAEYARIINRCRI